MLIKRWIVGGGEVKMEVPLVALASRMTRWDICGRRSHPLVSFSASLWAATTGQSASTVCNLITTLVKIPVRTMWYCGAGLVGVGRLVSVQRRNQTRVRLSAQRDSGAKVTHGDLTAIAWRNSKTPS